RLELEVEARPAELQAEERELAAAQVVERLPPRALAVVGRAVAAAREDQVELALGVRPRDAANLVVEPLRPRDRTFAPLEERRERLDQDLELRLAHLSLVCATARLR